MERLISYEEVPDGRAEPAVRVRIAIRTVEVQVIVVGVDVEGIAIGVPIACYCPYKH